MRYSNPRLYFILLYSYIDWTSQHGSELALEAADYEWCYTLLVVKPEMVMMMMMMMMMM